MQQVSNDPMAVFADEVWRADLAVVVRSTQQAAQRYATEAVHLAGMAARVPAPVGTGEGAVAWQSFLREIAVARGVHDTAAMHEVDRAVLLSRHLPRTLERLACGAVTVERARAFIDELRHVGPELAAVVDGELAARLHLLPPTRIRQQVRRAVDRHDADAAAVRAARSTRERGIRRTAERDGQASALVTGPAVPLARWYTALTDAAVALRGAGDLRGLDALRFDLLVAGFTAADDPAPAPTIPTPATTTPPAPTPSATTAPAPTALDLTPPAPTAPAPTPPAPTALAPTGPGPRPAGDGTAAGADELAQAQAQADPIAAARYEADRLVRDALAEAGRILAAAHAAEAAAAVRLHRAWAEADRLTARVVAERLAASQETPTDRRCTRPVQVLVHVPVETALGLANDPAWLEGYGWIDAPTCRQLLPVAELRQVCTTRDGTVIDLASAVVRPAPTPASVQDALLAMATEPFAVTDAAWRTEEQHDPTDALADLVRTRDRFCDGPTGLLWPARTCDLDHDEAHPDGPTAAWNLVARGRRTHRLKHRGWTPWRTAGSTTWFSPAGQIVIVPRHTQPAPELELSASLPDAQELHDLEAELVRTPDLDDDPPAEPPF